MEGPNPGGNGGTGGGVGICDCGGCGGICSCLYLTGGSVAKTSRRIDRRSRIVDLYRCIVSPCSIYTKSGIRWYSHPKPPASVPNSGDRPSPPASHVVPPGPPYRAWESRRPLAAREDRL